MDLADLSESRSTPPGVPGARDEIVVFVTTSSEEEAGRIGRDIVERRLAACANILGPIRSIFRWEGQVSEETERLLIIKSQRSRFEELAGRVKELHSYQVPEIIAVPIFTGWPPYLEWVRGETHK